MSHALIDLAWQFMPEKTLVSMLAHKCCERDLAWRRGDMGTIRAIVKRSRPVRGQFKKRVEAVADEIDRQSKIRYKRSCNKPIDWAEWRPKGADERRSIVFDRFLPAHSGGYWGRETCNDIRHIEGKTLFLRTNERYDWRVTIFGRPVRVGPRQMINIKVERADNVPAALMRSYGSSHCASALLEGRRVKLDFDALETRIQQPDGKWRTFPWSRVKN